MTGRRDLTWLGGGIAVLMVLGACSTGEPGPSLGQHAEVTGGGPSLPDATGVDGAALHDLQAVDGSPADAPVVDTPSVDPGPIASDAVLRDASPPEVSAPDTGAPDAPAAPDTPATPPLVVDPAVVAPFCEDACASIQDVCGVLGGLGDTVAGCATLCAERVQADGRWMAGYACQAEACSKALCLSEAPAGVALAPECTDLCDAAAACGQLETIGAPGGDLESCYAVCSGKLLGDPEMAAGLACVLAALQDGCDLSAVLGCMGGPCAQSCADLYDPAKEVYCGPDTAFGGAWPTLAECAGACPGPDDATDFYQFFGCVYSLGCGDPEPCAEMVYEPIAGCVEACEALLDLCGPPIGFLPDAPSCTGWCSGVAAGAGLAGATDAAACVAALDACPAEPAERLGQLYACALGTGLGSLCDTVCAAFYKEVDGYGCQPGTPLVDTWPEPAACAATCGALPDHHTQLAFYGCLASRPCVTAAGCEGAPTKPKAACSVVCAKLSALCGGPAAGFADAATCASIATGILYGWGVDPVAGAAACGAGLDACPGEAEAQGAALYDCLLPVPDHCDALCAAVAFCSGLPAPTDDCLGWCKMVSAGSPGTMAALVSCAAAAGADCAALAACLDAEP